MEEEYQCLKAANLRKLLFCWPPYPFWWLDPRLKLEWTA